MNQAKGDSTEGGNGVRNPDYLKDLFIADLEHFGESFWRNEEIGEKRLNFFLTLATAVATGLIGLQSEQIKVPAEVRCGVTIGALVGLLLLGVMTYLRLLRRNRVSDQYKQTLKHIRGTLVSLHQPAPTYKVPQPLEAGPLKWLRGGLAETAGAITALMACALVYVCTSSIAWSVAVGLIVLLATWVIAAPREDGR